MQVYIKWTQKMWHVLSQQSMIIISFVKRFKVLNMFTFSLIDCDVSRYEFFLSKKNLQKLLDFVWLFFKYYILISMHYLFNWFV